MFTDGRSKKVILLAHCALNQNAISDGTADYPGAHGDLIRLLLEEGVGIKAGQEGLEKVRRLLRD